MGVVVDPQHDRFSGGNPLLQVSWSPSSLSLYMRDPRLYYLERVEGWRVDPPPAEMAFGKVYHAALERFDNWRLSGEPVQDALHEAIRFAWDQAQSLDGWTLDEIAEHSGKAGSYRNTESLIRSLVWYVEEGMGTDEDPVQPIWLGDQPAVEVEFAIPLGIETPYGEEYVISGILDGIVEIGGERYVRERKTTGSQLGPYYKSRFDIDVQIDTYALASKVAFGQTPKGVMLEATQIGKTFSRFQRFFQNRTPTQIDEWLSELRYWIKRAEFDAEQGFFPCNRATTSLYGGHPMYEVISAPKQLRQGLLEQKFNKEAK